MPLIFGILLIIGLIATVTKANWFPYPSSWLKALGLAVPFWMGAVGVFSLMSWQFIFLFILAVVNRSPSSLKKQSEKCSLAGMRWLPTSIKPEACSKLNLVALV